VLVSESYVITHDGVVAIFALYIYLIVPLPEDGGNPMTGKSHAHLYGGSLTL
jgi:hypothetical protein